MVLGTDIKTKEFYNLGTDVIARSIHVEGITHIINYDLPETLENYINRIGRTGRSQTSSCAITFSTE